MTTAEMKRILLLAASILAFAACTEKVPYSVRMVRSEMRRCPSAAELDGMGGRLKWNYTTGLELLSFLSVYQQTADTAILGYVERWYDAVISPDGEILGGYKKEKYNLDHVCPGRTLLHLYQYAPKKQYAAAIGTLRSQLDGQPRTEAGAFWHKSVYPSQVWLDGLYMAEPFLATYASQTGQDSLFTTVARQFLVAAEKTYDPATGLYRHAWDESRSMFWADPVTGQSAHCWGRALGWYAMALVDVLDFFPEDRPERGELLEVLRHILETLPSYADPATGMWYQVLDCPGREGNYLEATCSAMFTYVYLKASRKGYFVREDAPALYESLVKTFIREQPDGTIDLTQCCAVAGLGGKENRSGTYDYYIGEKITDNDPKGVGPFIWASLEYERL